MNNITKNNFGGGLGVLYVILSAALFGTMPLFTRIAYDHGSNAYTAVFTRFLCGSAVLGLVLRALPGCSAKITAAQFRELLKISVPYTLTPILLCMSYNYIDGGLATTLHFAYPVAVMLIMAVFYKTRLTPRQVICAALCVGGMALLYAPGGEVNVTGIVLAVVSGCVYASYIVLLGESNVREMNSFVLAFWFALLAAVESGLIALGSGTLALRLDLTAWSAQAGTALFASVFAVALFQKGLFLCGEVKAALFSTFEPLTGIAIGAAVFGETLSPREIAGVVGILAASALLALPERRAAGE